MEIENHKCPELKKQFCFSAGFYVSGLNLTEDITYVLLHPYLNMRKLTMRSLSLLLKWTSEQSPGKEDGAVNIVCCDFVDVSHFCSLVIGLNYKLLGFDNVITDYSLCRQSGKRLKYSMQKQCSIQILVLLVILFAIGQYLKISKLRPDF